MSGLPGQLQHRRLLVVGGGQQAYGQNDAPVGIGRAIAQTAAREGARVVVADIDRSAAEFTAAAIRAEGGTADVLVADAADADQACSMVTAAAQIMRGLDAIAINTGISSGNGFSGTTAEEWDRVMAVNVRSHFLTLRAAENVIESGGAITLTSSTACRAVNTTDTPAYAASKAALDGLCAQAAKDFAPRRVRVNIVMPGLIDTSLGRLATAVFPQRAEITVPLGRQGTGWDVAEATVFLLSNAAAYITNVTLPVDGGLSSIH